MITIWGAAGRHHAMLRAPRCPALAAHAAANPWVRHSFVNRINVVTGPARSATSCRSAISDSLSLCSSGGGGAAARGGSVRCAAATGQQQQQQEWQREEEQQHQQQRPRFYAPSLPDAPGGCVELSPEEARHAVRVLRLRQGDELELADGRGGLAAARLERADRNSAFAVTTAPPSRVGWAGPRWVLAAGTMTLKGGRTDWLVEKATEIGAYALQPLVSARAATGTTRTRFRALTSKRSRGGDGVRGDDDNNAGSEGGRLARLALAATKQSLRLHALRLLPAATVDELLPGVHAAPLCLIAAAGAPPVLSVLQSATAELCALSAPEGLPPQQQQHEPPPCYLFVGPEGDFTEQELAALTAAGARLVGLGPTRLRTETAALALLAAAVLHGDSARA